MKLSGFITAYMLIGLIAFSVFLVETSSLYPMIQNMRTEKLMRECDALDTALLFYARAHRAIIPSTIRYKKKVDGDEYLYCECSPIYPKTLYELGQIRDEQAYFSDHIDLSKFRYSTKVEADGRMKYKLEVTLPNGHSYISPQSTR